MHKVIERVIKRLFPELINKMHLPHFARIDSYSELPTEQDKSSDEFYPRYCANIQLLDEHGNDANSDILEAVALPLFAIGENAGRLEPPQVGAIVEIAWAYGRADKPFIRTILPFNFDLPEIKQNESRLQKREGVYQHIDEIGNFENKTDESLRDIIGKLAVLECQTRKVTAHKEQLYKSDKTWIGSESENVLSLLSELMQTVSELAQTCATHKHVGVMSGPSTTGVSDKSASFSDKASAATQQKERLDPISK